MGRWICLTGSIIKDIDRAKAIMKVIESAMEKAIPDKGSEQTINNYGVSLEDGLLDFKWVLLLIIRKTERIMQKSIIKWDFFSFNDFLITFLNPEINKNHAQVVFTTHDTWQLSNDLLRRDEIWFTEKASDGVTTLYSLADFVDGDGMKIRKDESYEKNYLLGKYGAIPSLKSFDML